jgi:hypothetical protein
MKLGIIILGLLASSNSLLRLDTNIQSLTTQNYLTISDKIKGIRNSK